MLILTLPNKCQRTPESINRQDVKIPSKQRIQWNITTRSNLSDAMDSFVNLELENYN